MAKKRPNDCPLFLHRGSGQWAKKVRGKTIYFGTDKDAALKRWAEEKDRLLAGLKPKRLSGEPTLEELGNLFIAHCRNRQASGTLSEVSVNDYIRSIRRLCEFRGNDDQPGTWRPLDFAQIAEAYAQPVKRVTAIRGGIKGLAVSRRSPVTVAGDVRCIKAFLNWCADSELIPPPRYGRNFSPVTQKETRIIRARVGRRDLAAADLRSILLQCSPSFKPIVLLAINGGVGNLDVSEMLLADYKGDWLDLPRGKTGAPRRIWIWPETRAAIDAYLLVRRNRGGLLFYTRFGEPWLRGTDDAIGTAFTKARKAAGVARGTFYDLRRTFATVAGETQDIAAIRLIMGHTAQSNDMTALYTQSIGDDRLKRVSEHVRGWLFSNPT